MNEYCWRIVLRGLTFDLVARAVGGKAVIVQAAPVARWTVGRAAEPILAYYRQRGAQVERLEPAPAPDAPPEEP